MHQAAELFALAAMAAAAPAPPREGGEGGGGAALLRGGLFRLLSAAGRRPPARRCCLALARAVARARGYETSIIGQDNTVHDLIQDNLPFVIYKWLESDLDIAHFPLESLGHRHLRALVQSCAQFLVPFTCILFQGDKRFQMISSFAGILGFGETDGGVTRLMKKYFDDVYSFYFPLFYTEGEGASADAKTAREVDSLMERLFGAKRPISKYVVSKILQNFSYEPFGRFERFTESAMEKVLERMSGGSSGSTQDLFLETINPIELILTLGMNVSEQALTGDSHKALECLAFVLLKIGDKLLPEKKQDPAPLLRISIHVILGVMSQNLMLSSRCAQIMKKICSDCLVSKVGVEHLGKYASSICSAVTAVLRRLDYCKTAASSLSMREELSRSDSIQLEDRSSLQIDDDPAEEDMCLAVSSSLTEDEPGVHHSLYGVLSNDQRDEVVDDMLELLETLLVNPEGRCYSFSANASVLSMRLEFVKYKALQQKLQCTMEPQGDDSEDQHDELRTAVACLLKDNASSKDSLPLLAGALESSPMLFSVRKLQSSLEKWRKHQEEMKEHGQLSKDCIKLGVIVCELVDMLERTESISTKMEIAKCLGDIGSIDPYITSVDNLTNPLEEFLQKSKQLPEEESSIENIKKKCLEYLATCLFDKEPNVVKMAMATAKDVLSTESGQAALSNTNGHQEISSILKLFASSKLRPRGDGNGVVIPNANCWSEERWKPSLHEEFSTWICQLTSALVEECYAGLQKGMNADKVNEHIPLSGHDEMIACCGSLAFKRAEFAALLFPALIYDLIESNRHEEATNSLSRHFLCVISDNSCSRTTQEAKKVIIKSLELLRVNQVQRFLRQKHGAVIATEGLPYAHVLLGLKCLQVSRCALEVGMHCTSLVYLEMHCEQTYGSLVNALQAACGEETLDSIPEFQNIMIENYKALKETDFIYGMQSGGSIQDIIQNESENHGNVEVLAAHDAMQYLASDDQGGNKTTETSFWSVATSLKAMGLMNTLKHYLDSTATAKDLGAGNRITADLQNEIYWRLGKWDMRQEQGSWNFEASGEDRPPVNQNLFRSLCSLRMGDEEAAAFNLGTARLSLGRQMSLLDLQSDRLEKGCNELTQLQLCNEIEEVLLLSLRGGVPGGGAPFSHLLQQNISAPLPNPNGKRGSFLLCLGNTIQRWNTRLQLSGDNFTIQEPVLAMREVLLGLLLESLDKNGAPARFQDEVKNLLVNHLCDFSNRARAAGRPAATLGALRRAARFSPPPPHAGGSTGHEAAGEEPSLPALRRQLGEARALEAVGRGEAGARRARAVAARLLARGGRRGGGGGGGALGPEEQDTASEALCCAGAWAAAGRYDPSETVLEKCLRPAIAAAATPGRRVAAALALADYAAGLSAAVRARIESSEWERQKQTNETRKKEIASLEKWYTELREKGQRTEQLVDVYRHLTTLQREVAIDDKERLRVEESAKAYLLEAFQQYWFALSNSQGSDLKTIFKVIALWFGNHGNEEVNQIVLDLINQVPSFKFVPLTYQISSRIGGGTRTFQQGILRLVKRLCIDHPHHTLLQLFAIANGEKVSGKGKATYKKNLSGSSQIDRIHAANGLLTDLRKESVELAALIEATHAMAEAYIALAAADTTELQKKTVKDISFDLVRVEGRPRFDQCLRDRSARGNRKVLPALLTRPPPIDPSSCYPEVVRTAGWAPGFSVTESGIHRPKIVKCRGSDGREYRQLVKGEDDLRQDAVMGQAFGVANALLRADPAARARRLRVATYTIVPLSPDSGVLEWVEDTAPFGAYLTDARGASRARGGAGAGAGLGAHSRYYPNDWTHSQARNALKNAADKLAAFKEVCANFRPAFRHFFAERFPRPEAWHAARATYARSLAAAAVLGHVLGIGDRHANNILIHQKTAEVIHIDFGVTFEQGKILQTPETVPFRLTRDVVDGLGVAGAAGGCFRRSCEVVAGVLRAESEPLLTVLRVFLHDPLYKWMLSPLKAKERQRGEATDTSLISSTDEAKDIIESNDVTRSVSDESDAAMRVLTRIKQKLEGYEDPNGNAMSVAGQVKFLIHEAQAPENLCRLFHGWAPWL